MSSFSRKQIRHFAAQGATQRAQLFAVVVTLGTGTTRYTLAKSPSQTTRAAQEQGVGYVERTIATFLIRKALGLTLALGNQFTIQESEINPDEVATVWRIFDLTPGAAGEEDRAVCFKLD